MNNNNIKTNLDFLNIAVPRLLKMNVVHRNYYKLISRNFSYHFGDDVFRIEKKSPGRRIFDTSEFTLKKQEFSKFLIYSNNMISVTSRRVLIYANGSDVLDIALPEHSEPDDIFNFNLTYSELSADEILISENFIKNRIPEGYQITMKRYDSNIIDALKNVI